MPVTTRSASKLLTSETIMFHCFSCSKYTVLFKKVEYCILSGMETSWYCKSCIDNQNEIARIDEELEILYKRKQELLK
jgi:hypothetical protein